MKGNVVDIYKAFDGTDKKLVIPVYQRNYDWTTKQCEKLFDDIEDMIESNRPKHFFGAVVGNPEDSFTWVVIDGQQRMTTVSLLMLALVHAIEAGDIEAGDKDLAGQLMRNYLEFNEGSGQKFKLKPVKDDRDSYARLFGPEEHFNEKSKITSNYRYFRDRLRKTSFDAKTLWDDGISNLEVMLLDLEKQDNPQRIFESLNSTGLALKESDKIRNFILMDLSQREQNDVYEKYWNEMEKNVDYATDEFIRWFLVAQTSKRPSRADVYEAFKNFAKKSGQSSRKLAEELHEFSVYSRDLENVATGDRKLDRRLRRANLALSGVTKPLLWLTYRDYKNGVIDARDFESLVSIVESFIFRRVVANLGANSLTNIFAGAYSDIKKLRKNDEPYSEILAYLLLNRRGGGRFPSDIEFREAFQTKDFYAMNKYRGYFFDVLEQGSSKDVRDIAGGIASNDLTIEHIMPQTLNNQWREDLGADYEEIHSVWVNRIANLTITGYNSEYSNRSFQAKLTMEDGFKQSPYQLNSYVKNQERWGLEQLEARSKLLADRALELWPSPKTNFEPEKEVIPFEPMGTDRSFVGRKIVAIEIEGTKSAVRTWADVVEKTLRSLLEYNREGVLGMAEDNVHLETNAVRALTDEDQRWRMIDPALAVFTSTSTTAKIALLRKVCQAIGYDPDEILFYMRPEESKSQSTEADNVEEPSPYADLVALRPLIEELVGTSLSQAEMSDQIQSLSQAVAQHEVENPSERIGGRTLQQFLAGTDSSDITAEQALACLVLYQDFAKMMGNQVWHTAILNGEISTLLAALSGEESL